MSGKRTYIDLDPDYEDVSEQQNKRRKVMEEDAKQATQRKIESIIKKQFDIEVESKESELLEISEKLEAARSIMDRLRACIVANFYGSATQQKTSSKKSSEQTPMIHPTVKKFIGKRPAGMLNVTTTHDVPVTSHSRQELESEKLGHIVTRVPKPVQQQPTESGSMERETGESRQGRFKVKKRIIVGNLSKSIPADQRDDNDQATHKWMVYVRGPKESPNISGFVKKVWFFLHPSYRPNDLVEVSQPPFHLTRRGWGEFPVRVQIHFKDSRNKRVDIIHNLKLDRTYTGLQTLGAETVVDIEIERDVEERKTEKKNKTDKHNHSLNGSTLISHHSGEIKQESLEQGYNDQENTRIPCQTFPLLKEIKLEPIDHDYGKAACVSALSSHAAAKKGLESQMGSGQNGSNIIGHSPTLLTCMQTVASPSVITTQAISVFTSISQAHNHLKVIPSCLSKPVGNPGSILLTSPPGNIVLKAVGSVTSPGNSPTVNLKVVDSGSVKSGTGSQATLNLTLAQPIVQTGLQPNKLQNITPNKLPVNKPTNSGLIFLKCTDNQGKTFLIPQQINNTFTSPTKIVNSTGDSKTGPTNTSNRPVLLAGSLPTSNIVNLSASGNVNVQGKQLVQTLIRSPGSATFTNRPQKSPSHNGPVFFIKPDNINRTPLTVKTSNIASTHTNSTPLKVNSNLQIVRNCSQKQDAEVLCVKPVNQSLTPENQSAGKGQLKVTSQGLIHVQGQNISPGVGLTSNTTEKNLQNSVRPKQPIVLIPSNGKVALLPSKGKSLLNSVTNSQCLPGAGNNIILLNQSVSPLGGGNVVCVTPSALTNQTKPVSKGNQDMLVLQTKQSKSTTSTPNHVVIIPVSSEQNSSIMSTNTVTSVVMTTQNKVTNDLSGRSAMDNKLNEKNMIFVVQKDKNTTGAAATVLSNSSNMSLEATSSLLTSRSLLNTNMSKSLSVSQQMTQVTVSSSDARPKQVILMNQNGDNTNNVAKATEFLAEDRKCIMDPKKKKQKLTTVKEFIQPICVSDYPDILSLIRASVTRHPLVSDNTGRSLHPYSAVTDEEWLSWNVGKRRASEWQRASAVRKFILHALGGSTTFKGESLWTTKQILVWCRLHAYSPHYLERPLHPTGIDIQAETSLSSDKHRQKFSSLTGVQEINEELKITEHLTAASDNSEEEIDILSDVPVKSQLKVQDMPKESTDLLDPEFLPLTEGALYVEDMAQQIGVRLQQTEIEPGYFGTLTHGMLYKCMENFMSDVIRETFALQVNMGRYPDTLSVGDVYLALRNLSVSDFLTNKYLGVEDNIGVSTAPT